MNKTDFTQTIIVEQTPVVASAAILNIRNWWSLAIEGVTDQLDAEFTYHYKDIHYCKLKLIELDPGRKVVWQVLENYFKFTKDKSEWIGTKLVFDISDKNNKTEIRFTHEGLVPEYECYEICREAWSNYIQESLYSLITTGSGKPNPKEEDGFNTELARKWKLEQ